MAPTDTDPAGRRGPMAGASGPALRQHGLAAIEYALIASLLAMAVVAGVSELRNATGGVYGKLADAVGDAAGAGSGAGAGAGGFSGASGSEGSKAGAGASAGGGHPGRGGGAGSGGGAGVGGGKPPGTPGAGPSR